MRRTFDTLWIIDLGGDNLGARKSPNVFAIQIPVAIAIGIRGEVPNPEKPARICYTKINAENRTSKLRKIDELESLDSIHWQDCPSNWQSPFLPEGAGDYFDWPKIADLFPFHSAGSVFYRTWPISELAQVLKSRWEHLAGAEEKHRANLFRESRDRKITYTVKNGSVAGFDEPAIKDVTIESDHPGIVRYGYRCLDRQFAFFDFRLGDYLRPDLFRISSNCQLYLICPDSLVPGIGPLITSSAYIPDQHYFRGSFGGKDVIPLYRDSKGKDANITIGLLEVLGTEYGEPVTAEDVAAYVYGILGGQTYSKKFWNELSTPGPRIPITKEAKLFFSTRNLGRKLIWLHTYGERFNYKSIDKDMPVGTAQCISSVPDEPEKYPESFEYVGADLEIHVGDGRFGPVSSEVWNYEVSGLKVLQSWLAYRMKNRAGKTSSPLDFIRPQFWPSSLTEEFLELLWVVERTIAMEPVLAQLLEKVVSSPCFVESELPQPTQDERKLPKEILPAKESPLDV